MYQFLDRRLDELGAPAAFLLRATRNWIASVQKGRCPCHMTATHFASRNLEHVASEFGIAMFTLNGDGLLQLHFAPPGCPKVRDDEARLLSLFRVAVDGGGPALKQVAAALVDETAVERLTQAVTLVATHLVASHATTRFD
jgi:hypothetical protein